ncbi:uncharacterized protein LOC122711927 [Apis laboriosa]|uniref:uncharacterized protein LOC122711927 n=1 Tax=Apis laboriosa TaxID=183418 RepID=UPI001CC58753|nr:uncharacterized protein LOC122711927 [Apis laboriosa]
MRNFPRASGGAQRFIDLLRHVSRIVSGKKTYCLSRERRKYRLLRGISLITNDKKSTKSRSLLSRKPIDQRATTSTIEYENERPTGVFALLKTDLRARVQKCVENKNEEERDGRASAKKYGCTRIDTDRVDVSRGHRWGCLRRAIGERLKEEIGDEQS